MVWSTTAIASALAKKGKFKPKTGKKTASVKPAKPGQTPAQRTTAARKKATRTTAARKKATRPTAARKKATRTAPPRRRASAAPKRRSKPRYR